MKKVWSFKSKVCLNILVLLLFIIGEILSNCYDYQFIGSICEIISFVYAVAINFFTIYKERKQSDIFPVMYFTDRKVCINNVIIQLHDMFFKYNNEVLLPIYSEDQENIGKEQLLKKIYQILNDTVEANNYIYEGNFEKYQKIKNKIGNVYYETYTGDETLTKIRNLQYIRGKTNILIFNKMPETFTEYPKHTFIIYCKISSELHMNLTKAAVIKGFTIEEIMEYHYNKFKCDITQTLAESIYEYTKGNTGKISQIFYSQETLDNFKNNTHILYEIMNLMEQTEYARAREKLTALSYMEIAQIQNNEYDNFRYSFLKADLLHFENKYQEALDQFTTMLSVYGDDSEYCIEIIMKIAHIRKHLGEFREAINEINRIPHLKKIDNIVSLQLLGYSFYKDKAMLEDARLVLEELKNKGSQLTNKKRDTYDTYHSVILAYDGNYEDAHIEINKAIHLYEQSNSRYLNNCYFIKAEIYRHQGKYSRAMTYYQYCLDAFSRNDDFDIYSLTYVIIKFISHAYDYKYSFREYLSLEEIKVKCDTLNMKFNRVLAFSLDEFLHTKKNSKKYHDLKEYFDSYIFMIP